MVWKTIGKIDGTPTIFGGEDRDKVSNLFNGSLDIDDVDINSSLTIRDGKGKLRNPDNTFSYIIRTSAIAANMDLTIPIITQDDTFAVLGLEQEFSALQRFNGIDMNNTKIDNIGVTTISDLTEKPSPGSGDYLLASTTDGMRKVDIGNIGGGGGGSSSEIIMPMYWQSYGILGSPANGVLNDDEQSTRPKSFNLFSSFNYRLGGREFTRTISHGIYTDRSTLVLDANTRYKVPGVVGENVNARVDYAFSVGSFPVAPPGPGATQGTGNMRVQAYSVSMGDGISNPSVTEYPIMSIDPSVPAYSNFTISQELTGVQAGDMVYVRLSRYTGDALDTYTAFVIIQGISLHIS